MLVDTDDPNSVQASRIVDEQRPAGGEGSIIDGMPGGTEVGGDAGDRGPIDDHRPQRPQHCMCREPCPRGRRRAGVLAPDMSAAGAAVAADGDVQDRRAPTHRHVGQPPDHGVAWDAEHAALVAPTVAIDRIAGLLHSAAQHRMVLGAELAGSGQTQPVQQAETVQVGVREVTL